MNTTMPPADRALAGDGLPERRMKMLGLEPEAFRNADPDTFIDVLRACAKCDVRQICKADMKRDRNDPVWESYCPNAQTLLAFAREQCLSV
jgi:hypothetical protein